MVGGTAVAVGGKGVTVATGMTGEPQDTSRPNQMLNTIVLMWLFIRSPFLLDTQHCCFVENLFIANNV
jgi:hypothetical protein